MHNWKVMKIYLFLLALVFSSQCHSELVSDRGVMGVVIGMPVDIAMSKLEGYISTEKEYDEGWGCYELINPKNLELPAFFIGDEKVTSIQVTGVTEKTEHGIGIGSTKQEIYMVYDVVKVEPHKYYSVGEYLVVKLSNGNGLHFETKNNIVTSFHLTDSPESIMVEGCL